MAEVLQEACSRYHNVVEVLRSEVDSYGYDLVLEFRGIIRHVQLKTSKPDAATREQKIALGLAKKENGCIVWCERTEPTAYRTTLGYRFFGKKPGPALPGESLADELNRRKADGTPVYKTATHTKGDAEGAKHDRANHWIIPQNAFQPVGKLMDMHELFLLLFEREYAV